MARAPAVVIKVGSSSLTDGAGRLDDAALAALGAEVVAVRTGGALPILVTSGAIAAGRGVLGVAQADVPLDHLQALAAVGQGLLMARYAQCFAGHGVPVGQVLFTALDFGTRATYLNARRTLLRLLDWGVVPIVNENDTTATDEISLGDNDRLAALVAALMHGSLLVILTDTGGVYSADPRLSTEASLIEEVHAVDAELLAAAGGPATRGGTGGMASKLAAARIASWSGIPCVIAAAGEPGVVRRAIAGEAVGTRVRPRAPRLSARRVWIAFARAPRGRLHVDAGAAGALRGRGGSLLAVGVTGAEGGFDAGDVVEIHGPDGTLLAKGIVAIGSALLTEVAGLSRERLPPGAPQELVHRDDLVLLND